ncbi:ribose-phosphate diphosphokinase [Microbacterium azadirachtae]|jgi:ribose-phosphate pyrophosphokinase|uniref:Ribose-phosphate pyrophosphokinase n=1 Tax=Microbacterium azadirachtae TaxID=582680 RepID=A0A0F0KKW3_9MICO|nr:ribose-phosphate diphosphokinase [Microbacterium azadirachtae]KJL20775.1 Ribose-phosphate pyrophosphokinase [Microbacterium azadirachtae]UXW86941.1 ribose-phosphate diphosphokinase [Microbacterium azadirachtae]SDM30069.1 ribose-phosphate pyrophosphokinase [Microbacterium azadirachtae]SEG47565.1 ribose-phosphate pyrophosphokinase [Microbacterium azadirachtae]SEG52156.1 ribose-phosphate pyrophosphokinase [Microbacterium azadirachtae]
MGRKKNTTVELDRENDIAPGLVAKTKKRLVVAGGRSHPELTAAVAAALGTEIAPVEHRTFASGELYARFEVSIRGCDLFIVQSFGDPINEWLMETLIMLDAAKRASAKRITVVAPYYPYARQDKKGRGREPISARLVADMLKVAGADRVMSVDLHAAQIQGFFDGPVDHLFAKPVLLKHFEDTLTAEDRATLTIVSPDMGRVRVADTWSDSLDAPLAIIHKRRDPKVANQVSVHEIVGTVDGRTCLLVDDMIDTGGTIVKAAQALKANGARKVIVAATHAIFSDPASERLQDSSIDEVVVTDTIPLSEKRRFPGLRILPIAPLLATAIRQVFEDGSVTSMFDGAA